jgi:polynucleotide 5'-hydroxyl-kinase GRC3/NOL9
VSCSLIDFVFISGQVLSSAKELCPFIFPSTWSSAIDAITFVERDKFLNPSLPGVYLVKGPKNSGKSTFARMLVNRLLDMCVVSISNERYEADRLNGRYSRVAFLECDIGQPEFTPPGIVSLNVISHPIFGRFFAYKTETP